jgi:drug/metabolite transporter (DMT)-like permease
MSDAATRLRLKTRVVAVIVILSSVAGNSALSRGMKDQAGGLFAGPFRYLEVFLNPWVVLGVALLILWTLARMALLSWADLSYVLPVTALGYVLTVLSGRVLLAEQVSWQRWAGTLMIVAGVGLVGRTPIRTTVGGKAAG